MPLRPWGCVGVVRRSSRRGPRKRRRSESNGTSRRTKHSHGSADGGHWYVKHRYRQEERTHTTKKNATQGGNAKLVLRPGVSTSRTKRSTARRRRKSHHEAK